MKITRVWAMPNAWTFTIKPINEILKKYVGSGNGWVDPFAGQNSPVEWKNDIHPDRNTEFHLDAWEFAKSLEHLTGRSTFDGVLFDPPYSNRQISEHYKEVGRKATALDTSARFYSRLKSELGRKIAPGGGCNIFRMEHFGFWEKERV